MGAIHLSIGGFFGSVSDVVGIKSGLAMNKQEIVKLLKKHELVSDYYQSDDDQHIRIWSEAYEAVINALLYEVGRIETPMVLPMGVALHHKYKNDSRLHSLMIEISRQYLNFLKQAMARGDKVINPTPFVKSCSESHGVEGAKIALELFKDTNTNLFCNPWRIIQGMRTKSSVDPIELQALFVDEKLDAQFGRFFDQRYIDFLHRNFDDIDEINWRKFEGLTGEYFARQGFEVEMGEGRNDGNIDVRVWPSKDDVEKPPSMLIQCKRQKAKVGKVVVKALYADILHENAESGVIVTTSCLAPGARNDCNVRSYPIQEADRETVKQWVQDMRKIGTGIAS